MATVQEERLELRFKLWDNDGDGDVDRSDWDAEAKQILANLGESEASPKGKAVLDAYIGMWEYLAEKSGVGADGALSLDEFKAVIEGEVLSNGNAGFANVVRPTIQAIVSLLDTSGDGQISPAEFGHWLAAIGVDASEAEDAFNAIDANGNGFLSVDELVNAVRDYHAGTSDVALLGS